MPNFRNDLKLFDNSHYKSMWIIRQSKEVKEQRLFEGKIKITAKETLRVMGRYKKQDSTITTINSIKD